MGSWSIAVGMGTIIDNEKEFIPLLFVKGQNSVVNWWCNIFLQEDLCTKLLLYPIRMTITFNIIFICNKTFILSNWRVLKQLLCINMIKMEQTLSVNQLEVISSWEVAEGALHPCLSGSRSAHHALVPPPPHSEITSGRFADSGYIAWLISGNIS